jgi:hypothetical protein
MFLPNKTLVFSRYFFKVFDSLFIEFLLLIYNPRILQVLVFGIIPFLVINILVKQILIKIFSS